MFCVVGIAVVITRMRRSPAQANAQPGRLAGNKGERTVARRVHDRGLEHDVRHRERLLDLELDDVRLVLRNGGHGEEIRLHDEEIAVVGRGPHP
jgi:hypothetical protein